MVRDLSNLCFTTQSPKHITFPQKNCSGHIYELNSVAVSPGALLRRCGRVSSGVNERAPLQGQNEEAGQRWGWGGSEGRQGNRQRVPTFTEGDK